MQDLIERILYQNYRCNNAFKSADVIAAKTFYSVSYWLTDRIILRELRVILYVWCVEDD